MNSITLIGRLTADPKLSYTPTTQTAVNSFRLAVKRQSKEDATDFIQCKVFGRQAETLNNYRSKGDELAVHGRLETGSYKNKDGVTVYTAEVICDRVEFIGGSSGGGARREEPAPYQPAPQSPPRQVSYDDMFGDLPDTFSAAEDDIPF